VQGSDRKLALHQLTRELHEETMAQWQCCGVVVLLTTSPKLLLCHHVDLSIKSITTTFRGPGPKRFEDWSVVCRRSRSIGRTWPCACTASTDLQGLLLRDRAARPPVPVLLSLSLSLSLSCRLVISLADSQLPWYTQGAVSICGYRRGHHAPNK
jgi:hypothetical protein